MVFAAPRLGDVDGDGLLDVVRVDDSHTITVALNGAE